MGFSCLYYTCSINFNCSCNMFWCQKRATLQIKKLEWARCLCSTFSLPNESEMYSLWTRCPCSRYSLCNEAHISVGEKRRTRRTFPMVRTNVWWEISQIYIEYTKPIRQMSDEPWKFFAYTVICIHYGPDAPAWDILCVMKFICVHLLLNVPAPKIPCIMKLICIYYGQDNLY